MSNSVSRLDIVPVRKAFPHEAYDFTKWLENHIDVIGERIGLNLTVTAREKRIGDFILDLACETEDGDIVVIENQLEKSNHSHLGQLLTYMVGLDAKVSIWITTEARQEHQKVIEWLNEFSSANIKFYLIKVEAVRIGDSPYAPLFTVLSSPSEQIKELGEQKKEWADRQQLNHKFWYNLLELTRNKTQLFKNISPSKYNWIGTSAGINGIKFCYTIANEHATVELYIDYDRDTGEKNKIIFNQLAENKADIEMAFKDTLEWEPLEDRRASRIRKTFSYSGLLNEKKWPDLQEDMLQAMIRLEKIFKPYLNNLNLD